MRCSHLAGTVTKSSKGHPTILLSELLQDGGNMVGPVNSMRSPVLLLQYSEFFDQKQCSVQYDNNGLDVLQAAHDSFGRSITFRKENPYPERTIPVKTKYCSYHDGRSTM